MPNKKRQFSSMYETQNVNKRLKKEEREMYKCCIFDLDGTLLDTLDAITYTGNLTMESIGLLPAEREDYKYMVGDGAATLVERLLKRGGDPECTKFDQALEVYQKEFTIHSMDGVGPYDGIVEMLEVLKKENTKIAVLSNKPHPRTIENIETIFGKGYFDHIQGEMESQGVKKKPDPSGVYQTMANLGMKKEECLYIGDTNTDMMTGRNAGLDTVGVTWGFRPEEELRSFDPAYIAHHPSQIADIVKKSKM